MKLVDVRISSTMSGVPIKNQTIDRALDICAALIGADGIKRITLEWAPEEQPVTDNPPVHRDPPEPTQYPEQECAITDHPDSKSVELFKKMIQPPEEIPQPQEEIPQKPKKIPPQPPKEKPQQPKEIPQSPDNVPVFTEIERIPKGKLGKFTDLVTCGLGYHETKNGLIICYGSTKVYTTWNIMEALPYPIQIGTLKHLSKPKKEAISHFSEWIQQGKPKIYKDPDAEFRQMLIPETRSNDGGNYENKSGEYD